MSILHIILDNDSDGFEAHFMFRFAVPESVAKYIKKLETGVHRFMPRLDAGKEFFVAGEWPGSEIAIFSGSPAYPESPIALFPLRILKYKDFFPICFFSFVVPPRNIVISCLLAGWGPLVHTILLDRMATATSYARPALLLLVS